MSEMTEEQQAPAATTHVASPSVSSLPLLARMLRHLSPDWTDHPEPSESLGTTTRPDFCASNPNSDTGLASAPAQPQVAEIRPIRRSDSITSGPTRVSSPSGRGLTAGDATPDYYGSPPLRRAGLLQAISYNTPTATVPHHEVASSAQHRTPPLPHSQDNIRQTTMELSRMSSPPSSYTSPGGRSPVNTTGTGPDLIFPIADAPAPLNLSSFSSSSVASIDEADEGEDLMQSQLTLASVAPSHISPSFSSSSPSLSSEAPSLASPPRGGVSTTRTTLFKPSGLSLLRQEYEVGVDSYSDGARTPTVIQHSPRLPISIHPHLPKSSDPHRSPALSASVSERSSASPTVIGQRPIALPEQLPRTSSPLRWPDRPSSYPEVPTSTPVLSPTSSTPKTSKMRLRPISPDSESMSHVGSPASLMISKANENTPLLRSGTPRSSMKNVFGSSSPSPGMLDPHPPHLKNYGPSQPQGYSPPPRSPSPQLEIGIEAPAPTWKQKAACTRLGLLVDRIPDVLGAVVKSMPAVLLGCLLNVLDSVSYGMIIFPSTGVFANLGPMGVSMFFLTTVISQFTYALGGSGFAGANGSVMIEVVPFFHILATTISEQIGEENPREIIATTLVAYALSSVLTGLSFLLLGALKLGAIVGFFPRHILVGCIGGVGVFLIETGLAVSIRVSDDDLGANWKTLAMVFLDTHNLALWLVPLALAILLRIITYKYHHQLIFPMYFIAIPMLFYIIVAAGQFDLGNLRQQGWLFDLGQGMGTHQTWYKFYSYLDFNSVRFGPLWSTLPTQFALLFFNILHPPLNVPALAVSLDLDVDTNKELVGHGYSNLLAGIFGTVPNYLVYVNTLLFYRVGGGTRIAGFLLAVMTALLLFIGTAPIAYIPVVVVGSLIFVLGLDLVKEALWDTRHRTSRTEYITIISIMVCMTVWDFVIGVLFGIIMSCFFFVVQNSQRRSIRTLHTGDTAMSAVRRPSFQRAYLREVSKHTMILKLQGFLFFGTISYVEETIRSILEGPSWHSNPVQFLVLDLSLVAGVDMSSAEAFVRIHRFLSAKYVTLVFCGFSAESAVGKALDCVQVLNADGVELFSTFNDAMEWTENVYLRTWLMAQKHESASSLLALSGRLGETMSEQMMPSSPSIHLHNVGTRGIVNGVPEQPQETFVSEPLNTLVKAFSSHGHIDADLFRPIENYLERRILQEGSVLWNQNDLPDGLYIIESGILRATYKFADHTPSIEESMVPGTLAGEMSALSNLPRNATVTVERDAVVWMLSTENLVRLEFEQPKLARTFVGLILKTAKIDHDILLSALASRQ